MFQNVKYSVPSEVTFHPQYQCLSRAESSAVSSSYSYASLDAQTAGFDAGYQFKANVTVGVEGVKATMPVEHSLAFGNSKGL